MRHLSALVFCSFLSGCGGANAIVGSWACTQATFPDGTSMDLPATFSVSDSYDQYRALHMTIDEDLQLTVTDTLEWLSDGELFSDETCTYRAALAFEEDTWTATLNDASTGIATCNALRIACTLDGSTALCETVPTGEFAPLDTTGMEILYTFTRQ